MPDLWVEGLCTLPEALRLGITDGTVQVRSWVPTHPEQIGVVRSLCESAPFVQVQFPGEKEIFMESELIVLERHPLMQFLDFVLGASYV